MLYFTPCYGGKLKRLKHIVAFTYKVLTTRHDALYYGTDPNDLILLAILKKLSLYRKPMFAWKYIALHGGRLKRMFYDAFDCIFMITESHVAESVKAGLITSDRCRYVKWGEDTEFVDALKEKPKEKNFVLVATGKAYRDYETLCKAVDGIEGVKLKIFTAKKWGVFEYEKTLSKYKDSQNIEPHFVEDLDLGQYPTVLAYLYAEMKAADCAVITCKKVNFGVGFTNVLDAMVCGLPIITTYNKDNPIDVDARRIGKTVEAENADDLREKIEYLKAHRAEAMEMGKTARRMIETEYNIKLTAQEVLNVIEEKI